MRAGRNELGAGELHFAEDDAVLLGRRVGAVRIVAALTKEGGMSAVKDPRRCVVLQEATASCCDGGGGSSSYQALLSLGERR
jgi:hypothetical protein